MLFLIAISTERLKSKKGEACTAEATMWHCDDVVSRELGLTLASPQYSLHLSSPRDIVYDKQTPKYGTAPLKTVEEILNQPEQPGPHVLPYTGISNAEAAEADAGRLLEIIESLLTVLQGAPTSANAQTMRPETQHGMLASVRMMDLGLRTFSAGLNDMRLLMESDITVHAKQQMIVMTNLTSRFMHLKCCMDDMVLTKQAKTRLDLTEHYLQTAYNALEQADARMYKKAGSMPQTPLQSAHKTCAAAGLPMYASSLCDIHEQHAGATSKTNKKRKHYFVAENPSFHV